jgi:hypothetical protein
LMAKYAGGKPVSISWFQLELGLHYHPNQNVR